jgi:MFS family permease
MGKIMKENRQAAVPFILVTVFLDMMGIAIVIPVLPGLIATFTADRDTQTYWYGAMLASYGLMQFVSAPLLGALSDRVGRRPVLLVSIFGLATPFVCCALSSDGFAGWSDVLRRRSRAGLRPVVSSSTIPRQRRTNSCSSGRRSSGASLNGVTANERLGEWAEGRRGEGA